MLIMLSDHLHSGEYQWHMETLLSMWPALAILIAYGKEKTVGKDYVKLISTIGGVKYLSVMISNQRSIEGWGQLGLIVFGINEISSLANKAEIMFTYLYTPLFSMLKYTVFLLGIAVIYYICRDDKVDGTLLTLGLL